MDDTDLLLQSILDCTDGEILNIIQAARENTGTLRVRLLKAYHEIKGNDETDDPISLI